MTLLKEYNEALYRVLESDRLDIAKEIAADALGEVLEEYLENDREELDFVDNQTSGDVDYSLIDNEITAGIEEL